MDWIQLRIWVNPIDENGNWMGGGNNDLSKTVEIAAKAIKPSLKVLIDFHYSDWWTNPGTQTKPRAWEGLDTAALQQPSITIRPKLSTA